MSKKIVKPVKEEKKISLPFKFEWKRRKNRVSRSKILINGFLFTGIILSISSAVVDITCGSGLSKSTFHFATIEMPASVLYTAIITGLAALKFWAVMYIGMLTELKNKLIAKGKEWGKDLKNPIIRWRVIHILLVSLSLITTFNMATNSIGSGIRRMQQNIDNMTADSNILIELNKSVNEGIKDKRNAGKENIKGNLTAISDAKDEVDRYYKILIAYQSEYQKLSDMEKEGVAGRKIITKIVKEIPGATYKNAIYFNKADLQKSIQETAISNEIIDSSSLYEDAIEYDQKQINDTLLAIADKHYKLPNGTEILFLNRDNKPINIQLAISRLQSAISDWQNDTGDVGESSKMFALVATYIKAAPSAGGMGVSEKMLMVFIIFLGILQEIGIAACTPSATIDRGTLSLVSKYCKWQNNEEKEDFLIETYIEYIGDGVINEKDLEDKCQKSVRQKFRTKQSIIEQYSPKPKTAKKTSEENNETKEGEYSEKVDKLVKEIEELI
jgi:hypothetical protein